jgi:hypothetical protein
VSKVWTTSGALTSVVEVGHLGAGYFFLAVLGDSPKRQLVELEVRLWSMFSLVVRWESPPLF